MKWACNRIEEVPRSISINTVAVINWDMIIGNGVYGTIQVPI